jgi:hypothetical protein
VDTPSILAILPLSYRGNPGVSCVSYRGVNGKRLGQREAAEKTETHDILATMPETFLFYPAKADAEELNEHAPLAAAYAARAACEGDANIWILKPSDGAKGERIELMSDLEGMQSFLQVRY